MNDKYEEYELDYNELRAKEIFNKYKLDFDKIDKQEIIRLLEEEFDNYHEGSSEYLRILCGYLTCIGDKTDVPLMEKIKYEINMDVGCMVDGDWIEFLENDSSQCEEYSSKKELIDRFSSYYLAML